MLYLIGLGLSDETDVTVKGLEIVKKCSRVYLEAYTSILLVPKETLVCPSSSSSFPSFHPPKPAAEPTDSELTLIK